MLLMMWVESSRCFPVRMPSVWMIRSVVSWKASRPPSCCIRRTRKLWRVFWGRWVSSMSSRRAWCQSRLNSSCSRASSSVRLNISWPPCSRTASRATAGPTCWSDCPMLCGRKCGPSGRSLARAGWTGHVASGTGGGLDRFLVRGSREVPSIRFARRSAVRRGHWEPFVPKLSRLPLPSVSGNNSCPACPNVAPRAWRHGFRCSSAKTPTGWPSWPD